MGLLGSFHWLICTSHQDVSTTTLYGALHLDLSGSWSWPLAPCGVQRQGSKVSVTPTCLLNFYPLSYPLSLPPWDQQEEINSRRHYWEVAVSCIMRSVPTEIPEKINATLGVTVKVTNWNFTKDLNNISSPEYWNFTQLFKSQVRVGKSQIP